MKVRYRSILLALVACLLAASLASPAYAADKMDKSKAEHNIASIWVIWAKHGQAKAFEQGLMKHAAWRKSAGDPFTWHIYQPVVGSDLNFYLIRSGDHTWADMDSEHEWSTKNDAGDHFWKDVGEYVKYEKHFFGVTPTQYEHWIKSKDYRYYGVSQYQFKSGHGDDVRDVMKQVHAAVTEQKWPYSFSFEYRVGGSGGMAIITPMKNYAGMAEPSPNLMEVMTKALGSKEAAEKLFDKFSTAVKKRHYTVYMYRPDLSTPE